jgi:hypothetical protein
MITTVPAPILFTRSNIPPHLYSKKFGVPLKVMFDAVLLAPPDSLKTKHDVNADYVGHATYTAITCRGSSGESSSTVTHSVQLSQVVDVDNQREYRLSRPARSSSHTATLQPTVQVQGCQIIYGFYSCPWWKRASMGGAERVCSQGHRLACERTTKQDPRPILAWSDRERPCRPSLCPEMLSQRQLESCVPLKRAICLPDVFQVSLSPVYHWLYR